MRVDRIAVGIALALAVVAAPVAQGQTLVLKRAFIEKYKNRATIDGTFVVDHAHKHPNAAADDGDLHAAGRSDAVGLPMVSEVMNAAQSTQTPAVHDLQSREGNSQGAPITGAWRIWFEHPSQSPQVQFDPVPKAGNTNPAHCFEIHPITKFNGADVSASFQNIVGFTPHPSATAFDSYEKLTITLSASATAVTLSSKMAHYNYVEFFAEALGTPQDLDDGGLVTLANILEDSGGDVIVNNVRLIFVPGTAPLQAVQSAAHASRMHFIGIPRVSLNQISTFLNASGPGTVKRKLPYEIIVVAVLN